MNVFQQLCQSSGVPVPVREHPFHATRKWRMDYAWPDQQLALEVEGGVWSGGRHTRPKGFLGDVEKYNSAAQLGWRILRTTPKDLHTVATINLIKLSLHK